MKHKKHTGTFQSKLGLHIGPFRYLFVTHCDWGNEVLARVREHLVTTAEVDGDQADRVVHLVGEHQSPTSPADIYRLLPVEATIGSWHRIKTRIDEIWISGQSRHVIWTATSSLEQSTPRFDVPWSMLIMDITARGGGLAHAGLASREGAGLLFLAPPTGGKSTTLSTAPPDWQVLSDDAALVWPDDAGRWLASPLPAWGMIVNPERSWPAQRVPTDPHAVLKSLLILHKTSRFSLSRIPPSTAMPDVYRALREYPVTIMTEIVAAEAWFRTSAGLCRDLLCWDLSLPLHADIWPRITQEAA